MRMDKQKQKQPQLQLKPHSFHLNAQHMEQHMALGNRMCGALGQLLLFLKFGCEMLLAALAWLSARVR